MRGEALQPGKGVDPDELAVMTAALVRENGSEPHITLEESDGKVVAFVVERVWSGGRAVVARFPCHPFAAMPGYVSVLDSAAVICRPAARADVATLAVELIDRLLGGLGRDEVALSPHERRLAAAVRRLRGQS